MFCVATYKGNIIFSEWLSFFRELLTVKCLSISGNKGLQKIVWRLPVDNPSALRRSWMTTEAHTWGYEGIHESKMCHPLLDHINDCIRRIHTVVKQARDHKSRQGRGVAGRCTVSRGAGR